MLLLLNNNNNNNNKDTQFILFIFTIITILWTFIYQYMVETFLQNS